ncbi:MAG: O-antigen ligase family protein [Alphaproteobacteria bacterium]|nr:O-antigen ligase family protein [Alphaproteobacteria bacterium]
MAVTAALVLATVVIVIMGVDTTARVTMLSATCVLIMALRLPQTVERLLAILTVGIGGGLPFFMRLIGDYRPALMGHVKASAAHRLELWDYMSARVMERPLAGWGLWSSRSVPIHPDELSHYIYADGVGNASGAGMYPHNQFMQLWVEMGAVGVFIGLTFAIVVLYKIRKLSPPLRPFGYATYIAAITVAFSSFDITTDSWWAALAAAGFLFCVFNDKSMGQTAAAVCPPPPEPADKPAA